MPSRKFVHDKSKTNGNTVALFFSVPQMILRSRLSRMSTVALTITLVASQLIIFEGTVETVLLFLSLFHDVATKMRIMIIA